MRQLVDLAEDEHALVARRLTVHDEFFADMFVIVCII